MKKSNIVNYDTIFKLPKGLPTNSKQKHKLVIKGRKTDTKFNSSELIINTTRLLVDGSITCIPCNYSCNKYKKLIYPLIKKHNMVIAGGLLTTLTRIESDYFCTIDSFNKFLKCDCDKKSKYKSAPTNIDRINVIKNIYDYIPDGTDIDIFPTKKTNLKLFLIELIHILTKRYCHRDCFYVLRSSKAITIKRKYGLDIQIMLDKHNNIIETFDISASKIFIKNDDVYCSTDCINSLITNTINIENVDNDRYISRLIKYKHKKGFNLVLSDFYPLLTPQNTKLLDMFDENYFPLLDRYNYGVGCVGEEQNNYKDFLSEKLSLIYNGLKNQSYIIYEYSFDYSSINYYLNSDEYSSDYTPFSNINLTGAEISYIEVCISIKQFVSKILYGIKYFDYKQYVKKIILQAKSCDTNINNYKDLLKIFSNINDLQNRINLKPTTFTEYDGIKLFNTDNFIFYKAITFNIMKYIYGTGPWLPSDINIHNIYLGGKIEDNIIKKEEILFNNINVITDGNINNIYLERKNEEISFNNIDTDTDTDTYTDTDIDIDD